MAAEPEPVLDDARAALQAELLQADAAERATEPLAPVLLSAPVRAELERRDAERQKIDAAFATAVRGVLDGVAELLRSPEGEEAALASVLASRAARQPEPEPEPEQLPLSTSASPGAYGQPHPWDVEFARRRALVVRAEVSACYKKLDAAIEARTQQHAELSSYIAETVTCAKLCPPVCPGSRPQLTCPRCPPVLLPLAHG